MQTRNINSRSRLIQIIELACEMKTISENDIKESLVYENLIFEKEQKQKGYVNSDAFRMLISRDINSLMECNILKKSTTLEKYYVLSPHIERIREEYFQNIDTLYSLDLSDEELDKRYIESDEFAQTIYDVFSTPKQRRQILKKALEMSTFYEGLTQGFMRHSQTKHHQINNTSNTHKWPKNHGKPWSDEERQLLANQFKENRSIDYLAQRFQRTRRAIIMQLEELKIFTESLMMDEVIAI